MSSSILRAAFITPMRRESVRFLLPQRHGARLPAAGRALASACSALDLDAHHGDGVQDAFYDRNDVMTISLHESGKTLFPVGRVRK